ncbi:hypothetical protein DES53_102215 [Roseimicrobium gellanilyticum]|uniref:Prepilin-type N-terminal cleavage/methylation domain-containing protein n=2 Tax=Roseimicrobium gellanilyticum TaxID=748857 RepID=A0A366HSF6_9BACT|nr:hypothetical protein DES53_102215 [Roseimicrobium gellanilyticum]
MSIGCIIGLVVGVVGLLVLIIVAVLASLAIPAFQRVKAKASSAQTKVAIMDLEVAITAYQAQYNKLPDLAETDEKKIVESRGLLLKIIMGRHTPNDFGFYEPPPAYTTGKGRLITNDAGEFELLDPFGKMYHLHFDWDGDGSIPNPEHPGATIPAPVIIYSAGPDLAYDTWDDNVKSWGLLEQ